MSGFLLRSTIGDTPVWASSLFASALKACMGLERVVPGNARRFTTGMCPETRIAIGPIADRILGHFTVCARTGARPRGTPDA